MSFWTSSRADARGCSRKSRRSDVPQSLRGRIGGPSAGANSPSTTRTVWPGRMHMCWKDNDTSLLHTSLTRKRRKAPVMSGGDCLVNARPRWEQGQCGLFSAGGAVLRLRVRLVSAAAWAGPSGSTFGNQRALVSLPLLLPRFASRPRRPANRGRIYLGRTFWFPNIVPPGRARW